MDVHELRGRLLPTPFFASFVGRARPGDLFDSDPARRSAAWAHWAVTSCTEMTGLSDRAYAALTLPGRFYDPKGTGPTVRPHLEVPARVLGRPDPEFPDRLAQMGNGLAFPWWVISEVTAVKRALFNTPDGHVGPLVELLNTRRGVLADALGPVARAAAAQWSVVEGLLIARADGLAGDAAGDFDADEVAAYFPAGAELGLRVVYDAKLRERNRQWASRRVGVWQVHGRDEHGERFALGVVTPRLTANSLFSDPLFAVERESPAALLVRGLLLRRLVRNHLAPAAEFQVGEPAATSSKPGPRLRAIVARVGAKLPEASVEAAVFFLQKYPDPDAAWEALEAWARRTGALLTVTRDGFAAAHRNALRFLRRAEDPERDDINVVLPLAWDDKSRVVRVTFSRPVDDGDPAGA